MAKPLDPKVTEVLKAHGFGKDAIWDCHGVWVVYHRVLEQIAAQAGITFDPPQIVEAHGLDGVAALYVVGHYGEKSVWSIGEAAPKNNKNSYPWAMAEKRAIDRVILKLIGIHGLVYSEEEADDFKADAPKDPVKAALSDTFQGNGEAKKKDPLGPWKGPLGKSDLTKRLRQLTADLNECGDLDTLEGVLSGYQGVIEQVKADIPLWYDGEASDGFTPLKQRIEDRRALLSQQPHEMMRAG